MRERYPDAFDNTNLSPNRYYGQELIDKEEIKNGENVGVFFGGDKESQEKALNIAKSALRSGAHVTMFYRPKWFPERDGVAHDASNTFYCSIHTEDQLEGIIDENQIKTPNFHEIELGSFPHLDASYVVSTYWNRNLLGIRDISDKTIGFHGELAKNDDGEQSTELAYTMERYLIENVDEFRAENAHNRQLLQHRHLGINKPIKLLSEKESEISGKKVLYLPEFPLQENMVARWRHEWPSQYLGEYGVQYSIKSSLGSVLEKDENGNLIWKQSLIDEAQRDGKVFNDSFISEKCLESIKKYIDEADVVVFGRTSNKFGGRLFEYAKQTGKVVGYEVDDLIFGEHAISAYSRPIDGDPLGMSMSQYIDDQIRDADFVTVTTRDLANEVARLRHESENVYVVRNRIHIDELKDLVTKEPAEEEDQLRIGWAGSYHHIDKLLGMGDVIQRLYQDYGDKVKFVFKGLDEKFMCDPVMREKYEAFRQMMDGIPHELHGYTKQGDWKDYYRELSDLDLDIFLAPAKNDEEHRGKSELKYLEGAFSGAATVAHDIGGHSESINSGVNGLLVDIDDLEHSNEQFYHSIKRLVDDTSLRKRIKKRSLDDLLESYDVRRSSEELHKIFLEQIKMKEGGKK